MNADKCAHGAWTWETCSQCYNEIEAERDRYKAALERICSRDMDPSGVAWGAIEIAREALGL